MTHFSTLSATIAATATRLCATGALICASAVVAFAQTDLTLGGLSVERDAPVEITAESLSVNQETRRAIFEENVVIGQGNLRLAAGRVEVIYAEGSNDIARLLASGGVTFVTETEQAEAQAADYNLTSGEVVLTGDVLLTQTVGAIAAERMVINLSSGTARMEGRVRTVFGQ